MDRIDEQAALLALLRARTRGWGEVADAVEEAGSALEVLTRELVQGQGDLFAGDTEANLTQELANARSEVEGWLAEGMKLVTLLDPDYPEQLLTIHQRPPFLFYKGRLDTADAGGVAIVGTRKASRRGLDQAREIADGLARKGVVVISGLAEGIDTAAHTAALDAHGRTVAVIGTGLRRSYPASNRALQKEIADQHAVISQFLPDGPPTQQTFPMRNAVMSGYAAATVVVEANAKSGAKMQARLALEHGRAVFLLESLLEHEWAQQYSRRPGATVVRGPDDVLDALEAILTPVSELVLA